VLQRQFVVSLQCVHARIEAADLAFGVTAFEHADMHRLPLQEREVRERREQIVPAFGVRLLEGQLDQPANV